MKNGNTTKINLAAVLRVALIVIAVVLLCLGTFFFFKIRIEAKNTLREAKNVRMALRTTDIEMYAHETSVYDPTKVNGLADGVKEKVDSLMEPEGRYAITSYSFKKHEVTGMTYRKGNYYVVFTKEGDGITWDVTYLMHIYHFDEEDTKIVKK